MEMAMDAETLRKIMGEATGPALAELKKLIAPIPENLAKVEGSVKALEKSATEIDARLRKVEATPAQVGRPAQPVERIEVVAVNGWRNTTC